jgi:hypothetical protein
MILAIEAPTRIRSGSGALFGVVAAGIPPIRYQWQFRGNDLPKETSPTLLVHNLSPELSNGYSVVVANSGGSITSAIPAAHIISQLEPRALPPSKATNIDIELTGLPKRMYKIELSTNLLVWRPAGFADDGTFSVPWISREQFVRVSFPLEAEECITHLQQITLASKLWAIERQKELTEVPLEVDILPYLRSLPVCPLGGTTFSDSYLLNSLMDVPLCKKMPAIHVLLR